MKMQAGLGLGPENRKCVEEGLRAVTSGGAALRSCDLPGEPWTSIGQEQEARVEQGEGAASG